MDFSGNAVDRTWREEGTKTEGVQWRGAKVAEKESNRGSRDEYFAARAMEKRKISELPPLY